MPALQSAIRVNEIVNLADNGPVEFVNGITVPSGETLNAQGNVSISGISTVANIRGSSITATTINAGGFSGDGSGLTNIPVVTSGKVIAYALIS